MEEAVSEPSVIVKTLDLRKYYPIKSGPFRGEEQKVHAVDGVDLEIREKETLGLVGESGCGKSTFGRLLMDLEPPTSGRIFFKDAALDTMGKAEKRAYRREIQIIFQDPYSSLNPRRNVRSIVGEPLLIHKIGTRAEREREIARLLKEVGLRPEHMERYPHEFSGGQRQRIGIARALALKPSLIIADEPVSALDVSIRSQVLNIMQDLQDSYGLTYLFISHDLSVVEHISDRVAVMYLGKIVELGSSEQIYGNVLHPYTEALLSAAPKADPEEKRSRIILKGETPSPVNPPSGCRFHPRCQLRIDICDKMTPVLKDTGNGHLAACHVRAP
jgi:oligopeptide/dipeptide ABC transporter ATP-binding protein